METKKLDVVVYLDDFINKEFFKVYKIYEIPGTPNEEPIYKSSYLSLDTAKEVAKQLEEDNSIKTLIGIELVWLN